MEESPWIHEVWALDNTVYRKCPMALTRPNSRTDKSLSVLAAADPFTTRSTRCSDISAFTGLCKVELKIFTAAALITEINVTNFYYHGYV